MRVLFEAWDGDSYLALLSVIEGIDEILTFFYHVLHECVCSRLLKD